jgi:hypothetical protein
MLDSDLDMSFGLGKAVARTNAVVKIKIHIPILPDFLSLVRDAVFILRLSHDKWVSATWALFPSMNVSTSSVYFAAGTNHTPLSPSPPLPSSTTVEPSSRQAVIGKKRTVPPPSVSTAAKEKHTKTKKVRHNEIDNWLNRHVEKYQDLFCEVGSTVSMDP